MGDLKKLLARIKTKQSGQLQAKRRGGAPDQSLQHELGELSEAFNNTNTDLLEVKAKLESIARELRRNDLTKEEIAALPQEVS